MAQADVVRLFRDAQKDTSLRDELAAAPNIESFIHQAKHYGYEFTVEDWQEVTRFKVEELKCEMSEIPGI